jgi:hypothetical protein
MSRSIAKWRNQRCSDFSQKCQHTPGLASCCRARNAPAADAAADPVSWSLTSQRSVVLVGVGLLLALPGQGPAACTQSALSWCYLMTATACAYMTKSASVTRTCVPPLVRHHLLLICSPEICSKRVCIATLSSSQLCQKHVQPASNSKYAKIDKSQSQHFSCEFLRQAANITQQGPWLLR